ncbi:MAG: biopolymer transporter ExbD [Blastochloris sp.]|nr:biopolymer transporter ExbD [Blastochloris sp.]
MLDVMFVLLLFFMVSAGSNAKEEELGIKLPGNTNSKPTDENVAQLPIILKINKDGSVLFNDSPTVSAEDAEMKGLQDRLAGVISQFPSTPVIISPDPEVRHERVITVMDACSYAKVEKLAFRYVAASN